MALLEMRDIRVEFPTRHGVLTALRGVSFALEAGERLGIVGESGAGKSMAAFAAINLISEPGSITQGEIIFEGRDLLTLDAEQVRDIRGNRISMIFQDPMMTLNPVLSIGTQMVETLEAHEDISAADARHRAIEKLREVAIPEPEKRFDAFPHELSGGLRQRVVIAIALLTNPAVIIADEPTTALDVTIQAEILALLLALCKDLGVGLVLITHDLAVVSQVTQRVIVMYAGTVVEEGPTAEIIQNPRHPYTQGLIAALPQQNLPGRPLNQIPGNMPTLDAVPAGCAFNPRCTFADARCGTEQPELTSYKAGRVACHHLEKVNAARKAWK